MEKKWVRFWETRLVAWERDGGRLREVGSRKSRHGRSVAVRDSAVVDIVEDKSVILDTPPKKNMKMVLVLLGSWILVLCEDLRLKTQVLGDEEEDSSRLLTSFI